MDNINEQRDFHEDLMMTREGDAEDEEDKEEVEDDPFTDPMRNSMMGKSQRARKPPTQIVFHENFFDAVVQDNN